ncbi:hypothetical protein ACGFK1_07325 [Mycobacterium sp. NPDC048908]
MDTGILIRSLGDDNVATENPDRLLAVPTQVGIACEKCAITNMSTPSARA